MCSFKNIVFITFCYINVTFVIFERSKLTYINEKYFESAKTNVRRYSRRSPYYLNIILMTKHQWNNNVSAHFIFKQFLHNEYRRSFVEMHHKLCDLLKNETFIGGMLTVSGLICPIPAGLVNLMNMTVPTDKFPNVFPFEKGRVDIELTVTATGESMARGYVDATFINERKKPKAN